MYALVGHARAEMFSSIKSPSFSPSFSLLAHAVLQLRNRFNTITLVHLSHSALPRKILPPIITSIFNIFNISNEHRISIFLLCLSVGIVLIVETSKENSTITSTKRKSFAIPARAQSATLFPMQSRAMETAWVIWGIVGDERLENFVVIRKPLSLSTGQHYHTHNADLIITGDSFNKFWGRPRRIGCFRGGGWHLGVVLPILCRLRGTSDLTHEDFAPAPERLGHCWNNLEGYSCL